ncbi:MAG: hypothetical protein IJZ61_09105 [Oscillospiraceae bacterium]|nr:hypothetical protein [Oscillospiraceae bacterium]
MAVTDISMLRERRNKKKRDKFIKKLIIVAIAAAVILIIVFTKDMWYPKLDGILTKIPAPNNTAELAEGNFPLSIEGGADYQIKALDDNIALVDDSHLFIYNSNGKIANSVQHTLANPLITTGNKKTLLYDLGGKSFALYSKYKNIYEKTTDDPILLARLGSNDTAAVVIKSDKYPSELMVYDATGKNIFNYRSVSRIIDVTFNSDNSGCYITTIGADGGLIVSKMIYYRFDHIDYDTSGSPLPVWESEPLETLALSVRLFGENNIIMFGDRICAYFDLNGNVLKTYEYERDLVDYSSNSSIGALVFRNDERRTAELVTINCETGAINEKSLDHDVLNIQVSGDTVYIQTKNGIESCTETGTPISSVQLDTEYEDFLRLDSYIYLLGYDEVNRITFN